MKKYEVTFTKKYTKHALSKADALLLARHELDHFLIRKFELTATVEEVKRFGK